jgi:hypothetical protein
MAATHILPTPLSYGCKLVHIINIYEILDCVEASPIFKDRFFYNMEIFWEMV